jgi:exonuclease SbcC
VLANRSAALGEELIALATALELPADSVSAALAAVAAAADEARDGRVRAEEAHMRLGEQVAQREQLEAQIAADTARIKVLDVLATELKADHFVEFIVQETLDLLAMHASNELVRISDNRYRLASKDGDFYVIDQVNADEQRSVRTLSGGETFMASLALALALSQHVSELAGEGLGAHLQAVFIDEGFGALDPESLEEVIDALERLRDDELLVGVISHVPALAERIRIGLEVRKDGNHSTVVQVG